ncbi:hypothetical protein SGLAD_v1c04860 [Spiroplasma gladiatoris]|uniref:Uncharacterized protein n=1 Tax=Spiroplasma gladiatoris TaxID=2143 RepID=A0A4P7AGZ2_9MOLU|nr:hypothetical protein [Spiroplasma gladiatoris]QBQ07685.1 hypothetical protein SGLAD_v1c04860 [Spiroplasma gladiatoris]
MKKRTINIVDDGYFLLNEHQNFRFDKNIAKKFLEKIQFPIIILDTEFFNHSHDSGDLKNKLYSDKQKDIVYVIQYSFAKSFKEIAYRDNSKAIKSIFIKRGLNDKTYNFHEQYSRMITSFLSMCRNKEIKTIICAGASNDIKIINQWINDYKHLFARRSLNMAFLNKEKNELNANYFDIYEILENAFSFSNTNAIGEEFYNPKNLPVGKQSDQMIALTSCKKFFDWFESIDNKILKNEDDEIRSLCTMAYSFFSFPNNEKMSYDIYKNMIEVLRKVVVHCYNDVLKILTFLGFVYEFVYLPYSKNTFIKKD